MKYQKKLLLGLLLLMGLAAKSQEDTTGILLDEISIQAPSEHKLQSLYGEIPLPKVAIKPVRVNGVVSPSESLSESRVLKSSSRLAIGLSSNAYRGDLGDGYQSGGLAAHLSFMFAHEKKLHGGLHLAAGSFSGHELSQATPDFDAEILPNTYVKTSFISVHYGLQYDIIRYRGLLMYVSQGLGVIRFSPEDEFGNPLIDALATRASNESYSNAAAILPTQAGLDYTLPNQIGIGIKAGWLNTTSDYLDNLGQLGNKDGNDNIFQLLLQLYFPLKGNNP